MDDYLSDLTDFEGDDGETSRKMKAAPSSYKIRGTLQAPRATSYSTRHLYEMLEDQHINLDAEYQRDVVWPLTKQMGLIDSLFRNFYMPPIIFATNEEDMKICIDGKQRLSSIWAFMQGKIPFKDPETGQKFYYIENTDRTDRGMLLPEHYRKIFQSKQIVCVEYTGLSDANEREIFQRVQLGMALTPAERLQAVSSPMSQFIRDLQHDYISGALAEALPWDTARATDFRCLCVVVNIFDKITQGSSKGSKSVTLPTIPAMTKWLQDSFDPDLEFCADVRSTFEIFVTMARASQFKSCFNLRDENKQLKVSPAEFIMIAYLIHKKKAKYTLKQLCEAIHKMRSNVREIEKDIRTNSRVLKHMISFIDDIKASELKADAKNKPALEAYQVFYRGAASKRSTKEAEDEDDSSVDELESDSPPPKKAKGKRKRAKVELSDDEDDEEYVPKRKATSPNKGHSRTTAKPKTPKTHRPLTPPSTITHSSPAPAPKRQPSPPPPLNVHRDRLAALRAMQAFDSTPSHPPTIPALLPAQEWPNSGVLRMGPSFPAGPPPNLGQSVMDRAYPRDSGYTPGAGSANPARQVSGSNASVPPGGDRGYGQRYNR